jgi:hypothetical protein
LGPDTHRKCSKSHRGAAVQATSQIEDAASGSHSFPLSHGPSSTDGCVGTWVTHERVSPRMSSVIQPQALETRQILCFFMCFGAGSRLGFLIIHQGGENVAFKPFGISLCAERSAPGNRNIINPPWGHTTRPPPVSLNPFPALPCVATVGIGRSRIGSHRRLPASKRLKPTRPRAQPGC